jgi:pimeloyl-ACP methyl ester carboxylesterase
MENSMNRRVFVTRSSVLALAGAIPASLAQLPVEHFKKEELMVEKINVPHTSIHRIEADGLTVFYREAGPADAPTVLLLHGFPTSSFQYRELIPRLADRYRVIAPDLPGFGFTEVPEERQYEYTFDALANTILAFTNAMHLKRYALYVFDYSAPVGFRLAMARPDRITAIVSQNGNAYEEGLGEAWPPIRRYWSQPTSKNRESIRKGLTRPSDISHATTGAWRPWHPLHVCHGAGRHFHARLRG